MPGRYASLSVDLVLHPLMEVDDLKAKDKMKNTTPLEEMKHTGTAAPVPSEAEVAARVEASWCG